MLGTEDSEESTSNTVTGKHEQPISLLNWRQENASGQEKSKSSHRDRIVWTNEERQEFIREYQKNGTDYKAFSLCKNRGGRFSIEQLKHHYGNLMKRGKLSQVKTQQKSRQKYGPDDIKIMKSLKAKALKNGLTTQEEYNLVKKMFNNRPERSAVRYYQENIRPHRVLDETKSCEEVREDTNVLNEPDQRDISMSALEENAPPLKPTEVSMDSDQGTDETAADEANLITAGTSLSIMVQISRHDQPENRDSRRVELSFTLQQMLDKFKDFDDPDEPLFLQETHDTRPKLILKNKDGTETVFKRNGFSGITIQEVVDLLRLEGVQPLNITLRYSNIEPPISKPFPAMKNLE